MQVLVCVLLPGQYPVYPAEQLLVLVCTPIPQDTLHVLYPDHGPQTKKIIISLANILEQITDIITFQTCTIIAGN